MRYILFICCMWIAKRMVFLYANALIGRDAVALALCAPATAIRASNAMRCVRARTWARAYPRTARCCPSWRPSSTSRCMPSLHLRQSLMRTMNRDLLGFENIVCWCHFRLVFFISEETSEIPATYCEHARNGLNLVMWYDSRGAVFKVQQNGGCYSIYWLKHCHRPKPWCVESTHSGMLSYLPLGHCLHPLLVLDEQLLMKNFFER